MKAAHGPMATGRGAQRGAVALEFALVAAFFLLTLLVGVIEMGRVFYVMNAAAEATRWGARVAVVCDRSEATREHVVEQMQRLVPALPGANVDIQYACPGTGCRSVTVRILPGATFESIIPFVPLSWPIPSFSTTLPTESLDSAAGANAVCQ